MPITRMNHAVLYVRSARRTQQFYADVLGFTRYQYLCAEDYDEDFSFDCVDAPPSDGSEWYTVCGRPHTDFPRWMLTISLLAALGVGCFSYLLLGRRPPRPE